MADRYAPDPTEYTILWYDHQYAVRLSHLQFRQRDDPATPEQRPTAHSGAEKIQSYRFSQTLRGEKDESNRGCHFAKTGYRRIALLGPTYFEKFKGA